MSTPIPTSTGFADEQIVRTLTVLGEDVTVERIHQLHTQLAGVDAAAFASLAADQQGYLAGMLQTKGIAIESLAAGERDVIAGLYLTGTQLGVAPVTTPVGFPGKEITAYFWPQEYGDFEYRDCGDAETVDVTQEVLALDADRIHELEDDTDSTNDLVSAEEMGHEGPHRVEVVESICDYFDVGDLCEITQDMVNAARAGQPHPTTLVDDAAGPVSLESVARAGVVQFENDRSQCRDGQNWSISVRDAAGKLLIGTTVHADELADLVGDVGAGWLSRRAADGTYVITLNPQEVMGLRGTLAERIARNDWSQDLQQEIATPSSIGM